jgi:hypothetical protein
VKDKAANKHKIFTSFIVEVRGDYEARDVAYASGCCSDDDNNTLEHLFDLPLNGQLDTHQ